MQSPDPYSLIERTALRARRRKRLEVLLPALPPAVALAGASFFGRLPVEIAVAAAIALAFLSLHVAALTVGKGSAGTLLDRELRAKDHFLTLATLENEAPSDLRSVVESGAAALATGSADPRLPVPRRRPMVVSLLLSLLGFLFLWVLPDLPSAATGDPLERIAAELEASADPSDRALANELRAAVKALHDPSLSAAEKRQKAEEVIAKIDKADQDTAQRSAAGSSGGKQGGRGKAESASGEGSGGSQKGGGVGGNGQQPNQQAEGQGGSGTGARGDARNQLSKVAGELGGEQKESKSAEGKKEGQNNPQPSGGGIKGPESGAKQRQQDGTGNQQSGTNPNKPGNEQKPSGDAAQGEAKQPRAEAPQAKAQGASNRGQGGEGGNAGQKPSPSADGKPAERYYKPGEGPGGSRVGDGRYVRVRVPEEGKAVGTEIVAGPGEVAPETPYGNAPLPSAGAPGEVTVDQPQPLEYRDALNTAEK